MIFHKLFVSNHNIIIVSLHEIENQKTKKDDDRQAIRVDVQFVFRQSFVT